MSHLHNKSRQTLFGQSKNWREKGDIWRFRLVDNDRKCYGTKKQISNHKQP